MGNAYMGKLRKIVLTLDNILHFGVALVLLACAVVLLVSIVPDLFSTHGTASIIHLLNNVLLVLIFLEILWPVIRFLQKAPFKLSPFLYVGIISSTRRLLLIEAESSIVAKAGDGQINWQVPLELGVNVGVILVLAIALKLIADQDGKDDLAH